MIFNSLIFIAFITCFFAGWPLVKNRTVPRYLYVLSASLFFYGWWNWYYLFVLLISGMIDFAAALVIDRCKTKWHKKLWLTISMVTNLGMLGTFKYSAFIVENLNALLHAIGFTGANLSVSLPEFFLVLPVGISFYTFQSMSYTIDVYRGQCKPTTNLLHFFTYLTLFPQLVAGPIERATNLLPQVAQTPKPTTEEERWQAFCLIAWGYFKKMVVADNLALFVDEAFAATQATPSCLWWWTMMIGFAFQIYCDFSGYTDIARGLARWMGLHLMKNFRFPYFSTDIREFWTRWHISLSSWFRDYVYIPLGGNRKGTMRTYLHLWITRGLSGLWHGSQWTFVAWGLVHAFFSSIERCFHFCTHLKQKGGFGRSVAWVLTSIQIIIAWVFFRAENFSQACTILQKMFSFSEPFPLCEMMRFGFIDLAIFFTAKRVYFTLVVCGGLWFLEACYLWMQQKQFHPIERFHLSPRVQAIFMGIFLFVVIFFRGPGKTFIYFQF